jgi:hypothetical protein
MHTVGGLKTSTAKKGSSRDVCFKPVWFSKPELYSYASPSSNMVHQLQKDVAANFLNRQAEVRTSQVNKRLTTSEQAVLPARKHRVTGATPCELHAVYGSNRAQPRAERHLACHRHTSQELQHAAALQASQSFRHLPRLDSTPLTGCGSNTPVLQCTHRNSPDTRLLFWCRAVLSCCTYSRPYCAPAPLHFPLLAQMVHSGTTHNSHST